MRGWYHNCVDMVTPRQLFLTSPPSVLAHFFIAITGIKQQAYKPETSQRRARLCTTICLCVGMRLSLNADKGQKDKERFDELRTSLRHPSVHHHPTGQIDQQTAMLESKSSARTVICVMCQLWVTCWTQPRTSVIPHQHG